MLDKIVLPGTYPGPGQAQLLREGQQQWLFQQAMVTPGLSRVLGGANPSATIGVQLSRIPNFSYPFGASMSIWFTNSSGAAVTPGAFEVDWQNADVDFDAGYVTVQSVVGTASLNGDFQGRIELPVMWARYMRAYLKLLPNAGVYTNILVTR